MEHECGLWEWTKLLPNLGFTGMSCKGQTLLEDGWEQTRALGRRKCRMRDRWQESPVGHVDQFPSIKATPEVFSKFISMVGLYFLAKETQCFISQSMEIQTQEKLQKRHVISITFFESLGRINALTTLWNHGFGTSLPNYEEAQNFQMMYYKLSYLLPSFDIRWLSCKVIITEVNQQCISLNFQTTRPRPTAA